MGAKKGTLPPAAGMGRIKGVPNKVTKELKDMIETALNAEARVVDEDGNVRVMQGGVEYLIRQRESNPQAFLTLVGKLLPRDINANVNVSGLAEALARIRRGG